MLPPPRLDCIAQFARVSPEKLAVNDLTQSRRLTYAELEAAVQKATVALTKATGNPNGQRIVVGARNRVKTLIVHFACIRCGAIFVPVNWRLAPAEVAYILADCRP